MDIISIIIPVYNVEKYLERCLNSIIQQTYANIEIILVNDGSRDSSLQICREYQSKDNRIKIIDKVNEGVSVARNKGLEAATGKFIGFVDPDDWIEPKMFGSMHKTIQKNKCDIAFCNYSKDTKISSSPKLLKTKKDVLNKQEIIDELICNMIGIEDILPKYYNIMGCVWRCLYRKDFIDKYNLRFKPGITIMEDLIFTVESLINANSVCIDRGVWYHYMQNKTSSLHAYIENMWNDQIRVHDTLEQMLSNEGLDEYMRNRLDSRYIAMAACSIGNEMYRSTAPIKEKMDAVKIIINDEKLKAVIERAKKFNFESIKNSKNKEEIAKETKIIKGLLKFMNSQEKGKDL